MRVAYVCADPGVPVFGRKGASVHVQEVIRAFRRRGADVRLFAARLGEDVPDDLVDLAVQRLAAVPDGDAGAREGAALAANAELGRRLAERPYDLVYERYSLWSHAAMEHARATATPGVLEVNAPLIEEQRTHRTLVDEPGARRVARVAMGAASTVVAVSAQVAAWAEHFTAPERISVVANGVDPQRFDVPTQRHEGAFTVGFVGTLKPWHGIDTLVAAVALLADRCPDVRLLVVGDGPGRAALERAVADAGLCGRTELTGAAAPAEVPALLARMDVATAPYPVLEDPYFSPLKVLEYLAAGVPVVASRVGQLPELVDHGRTGVLVPPGDAPALAAALGALRDDPTRRRALATAGRAAVVERHTWDAVAGRILTLAGLPPERRT